MARRAHGDGTVYYDAGKDRWIGAVKVGGRRRKVTGKDKTEATAKLRKLLAARETDTPVADRKMSMATLLDTFITREIPARRIGGRPLAARTVEAHRWAVQILTDEIGSIKVAALEVEHIEAMYDRLAGRRKKPLSAASLRKIRSTLVETLDMGIKRRKVTHNLARIATIPDDAKDTRPRTALTPDQARTLLAALATERNGAMFALQLRVGLRPGEASGLFWDDLNDDVLNVTRGVQMVGGTVRISDDLKTSGSKRTIQLPAELVDTIANHRRAQLAERLAAERWIDDRLMFTSPTGNVLDPSNVRRQFTAICKRAGVPTIRPNELRHSCASLLADAGVSHEQIADLLGHTTTRMVDRTYVHRLRPVVDIAARVDWTSAITTQ